MPELYQCIVAAALGRFLIDRTTGPPPFHRLTRWRPFFVGIVGARFTFWAQPPTSVSIGATPVKPGLVLSFHLGAASSFGFVPDLRHRLFDARSGSHDGRFLRQGVYACYARQGLREAGAIRSVMGCVATVFRVSGATGRSSAAVATTAPSFRQDQYGNIVGGGVLNGGVQGVRAYCGRPCGSRRGLGQQVGSVSGAPNVVFI